ncbi:ORF-15 [Teiidae poxvirus 1]|nr:ORF-15 [Teiidae poxvirus 1]
MNTMDINVIELDYNQEVINYMDSIKNLCSCCVLFPDSINKNIQRLLNIRNSRVIGMFKVTQANNVKHNIIAGDRIIVYGSLMAPEGISIRVVTSSGTKFIHVYMCSLVSIKCNSDYLLECISEGKFEIVILGLRKIF